MSNRNKNNKVEILLDKTAVPAIIQKVKDLKQQWNTFKSNKEWILGLLFVCSIVHSILQYGLFGINIFEFYTLTDFFVNFAYVFIPFILLVPFWILLSLLPDCKTKCSLRIIFGIKIIVFVFSSFMISLIFQNSFGVLTILYILSLLGLLYFENKKVLAWAFILLFLLFSLGLPIEKRLSYKVNTPLVDRLSFTYSEKMYDLSDIDRYFYIGGSIDYFFIYNKCTDKVDIIPKMECKNICRRPFYWSDFLKSETFFNSSQREFMDRSKRK